MAESLWLSDKGFRITVTNILKVLMKEVGNVQEQMGYISKEIETMWYDQREMKNAFDVLKRETGQNEGKNQWNWTYVNRKTSS